MLFTGIMYMYFTPKSKQKYIYITLCILLLVVEALRSTMFTTIVYMGATMLSIAFIGRKIKFSYKLVFFILGLFSIIIIQTIKGQIRGKSGLTNTANTNFINESITSADAFFPFYVRFNQGLLTAMVIERIPKKQDYDNGESLITSILSSLIPRIVWPDKPESGGKYNMEHFAGFILRGYTMNIGPPGEAYGNFGVLGGVVFMFFFGLAIRFFYIQLIKYSLKIPLMVLWIPVLFFQVLYCMENDVLQAVNALVKGSFFIFLLYRIMPEFFKIKSSE
jgi:hypothetical protein